MALITVTRRKLYLWLSIWAAVAVSMALVMYALALTGKAELVIGGDFLAFYAAAKGAAAGDAVAIYDRAFFDALVDRLYETTLPIDVTWQYPPSYLLLVTPLAFLPHLAAYALWSTATGYGFYRTLRLVASDRLVLYGAIISPAAYIAYITGQNGFLTAALFVIAARRPQHQPLIAGVAAGLLTLKPHLGLLLPIAYMAGGCWRAAGYAAATALVLVGVSTTVFGVDSWLAFAGALTRTSSLLQNELLPLYKMATPYSAALYAGAPHFLARIVFALFFIAAAYIVAQVWRRCDDDRFRIAVLLTGVLFTAPYGYYYELTIMLPAVAIMTEIAARDGWLKYERTMLVIAAVMPMAPGMYEGDPRRGISFCFIAIVLIATIVVRRLLHRYPGILALRSERPA